MSFLRCVFSQKSALFPKTRESISAVGTVTARRLLHSSFTCLRGTPMASASAAWVRPKRFHELFNEHFADAHGLVFCDTHGKPQ